jgi:hypothetical protein
VPDAKYATVHRELVLGGVLNGTEFDANNGKDYDFLHSFTLNGVGRGIMESSPIAYYKIDAMKTQTKKEWYQAITKADYFKIYYTSMSPFLKRRNSGISLPESWIFNMPPLN